MFAHPCSGRPLALIAIAALACLVGAGPAIAAPMACPLDQGFSVCTIVDGNTALEVRASSLGGGELLVTEFVLDGVNHIGFGSAQGFAIYDLIGGSGGDTNLDSITADPVTQTIEAQFTSLNGAFLVDAAFTLTGADTSAILDETFTVTALVNGLFGRVYAVTDFDVAGDFVNDSITSTPDGALVAQVEGDTTATIEVTSGPLPDAFEVAACCNLLSIIFEYAPLMLSGATSAPGPDDFVSAVSWDWALDAGQNFQVSLRKTVEPTPPCIDGIDNDLDGFVDYPTDPGCDDPMDTSERSPVLVCDDGIDNDLDGRVDFDPLTFADPSQGTGDPGCKNPKRKLEDPQCQDGINNDGDGLVDFDGGASLNGGVPLTAPDPQCTNSWRNKERSGCGLGAEMALLLPLLMQLRRRFRRGAAVGVAQKAVAAWAAEATAVSSES